MRDELDVTYGTGNGRELKLDVYRPDGERSLRTGILMFHGGGWRRGDRTMMTAAAKIMQADGFTAMPVEYRLLGESAWPAAVHDVKAAVRWARANAERLEIEPDRIVLECFSAGAQLSLVAAGTVGDRWFEGEGGNPGVDTSVAAIAAFYAPTRFHVGDVRERGSLSGSALLEDSPSEEAARRASPLSYISPTYPPTFFLHGGADRTVPPSASIVMHDALRAAGVETDLHIFAGQLHAFDHVDVFRELAAKEVGLFFRRMVSEREQIKERVLAQSLHAQRAAAEDRAAEAAAVS